eukprot:11207557-Lingulodinium_polyedra.AAC.1
MAANSDLAFLVPQHELVHVSVDIEPLHLRPAQRTCQPTESRLYAGLFSQEQLPCLHNARNTCSTVAAISCHSRYKQTGIGPKWLRNYEVCFSG